MTAARSPTSPSTRPSGSDVSGAGPSRQSDRGLLVCSLAACLALAGCAALPVPGDPGAVTTPPTPTAASSASPPGVDATGVANASALAAAHRRASAADGVAFVASTTTRGRGPPVVDGPPNRTRALRAVVAGGGDRFRVRQRVLTDDGCKVVDRWSNGSTVLTRQRRADAPTVTDGGVGTVAGGGAGRPGGDARADTTRRSLSSVAAPTSAAAIERMLARGNYTLAAVQSGDSGRRFVLVADEYVPGPDGAVEADRVGMSARAVVDASGRVRSLQATVVRTEWSRLGTTRRVRSVSYRAVAVGVGPGTVPQPEWLAAEADGGGDATGGPATVDRQSGATGQGPVVGRAGAATCGGEAG